MRQIEKKESAIQKMQPVGYVFTTEDYERFQVVFVSQGKLFFSVHGKDTVLGPGKAVLLRIGSTFQLHCEDVGYKGVGYVCEGVEDKAFFGSAVYLTADADLHKLAAMLEREFASPGVGSKELLTGLGRALAWKAIRLSAEAFPGTDRADYGRYWAERAKDALEVTVHAPRSARDVLAALPLSYRQLSRYMTDHFQLSPKEFQLRARIREAENLLRESNLSITAVAMELGYASSQHFAVQFRQVLKETPSEYRRRVRSAQ
jgi:AraC-like DNA-binding protein